MPRKILHLDLDAFFCAVEAQNNPELHGRPFAVGGRPEQRGVVASCSYPARAFGVRSAMPMARALQLCPTLTIVSSNYSNYATASQQVMTQLYNLTDLVEQISIDEAFLDISDLRPPLKSLARELQTSIWETLQLPCSIGAASNKLVAKIANNIGKAQSRSKAPPMAITLIPPGHEAAFLAPLAVRELWGVGPKTAEALEKLGITTIGELARWPADDLARRFGKHGHDLAQRAHGIDQRPLSTDHEAKSISNEITFSHDESTANALYRTLCQLSESVGWRLRRAELHGRTVKVKLRWSDFTTLSRQVTLAQPTNLDDAIYSAARKLFTDTWPPGKAVRLIGVGISNFNAGHQQLNLWDTDDHKAANLQETLDKLRTRYGKDTIQRASELDPREPS